MPTFARSIANKGKLFRIHILIKTVMFFIFTASSYSVFGANPQTHIDSAGIYGLLPINVNPEDWRVDMFLDHEQTAGISVRTTWETVEPREDEYNWSYIDAMIDRATAVNKRIMLRIKPAWVSPDWVYDAGAEAFWYDEKHNNYQRSRMPVPWDAVFLEKWNDFVRDLGARYNDNPDVVVVIITGASRSTEMYLPNSTIDKVQWDLQGYSDKKIIATWNSIIDTFASAFPTTAIMLPVSNILYNDGATEAVVEHGTQNYPWHMVAKINYWKGNNDPTYYPTAALLDAVSSTHGGLEPVGSMDVPSAIDLALDWKTITWIEPYQFQIDELDRLYNEVTRHQQIVATSCLQAFTRRSAGVRIRWTIPSNYEGFERVRLLRKAGGYPKSADDPSATVVYEGGDIQALNDGDVEAGIEYYYSLYELPSDYVIGQLKAVPGSFERIGNRCPR